MKPSALAVAALVGALVVFTLATPSHATLNACAAAKKKCVAKKVAALLKCHIKAETPPKGLAAADLAKCIQTAKTKFDGGANPAKGCFAKLEAKLGAACLTMNDTAALETKVDAFVDDAVCALDPGSCIDPCAGHVYYAGTFDGASSVWSDLPAAGGMTGLAAGDAQCQAAGSGSDHVCDYEEVLAATTHGELSTIPQGTTAWIHRTTSAIVSGVPSAPGPGGTCNDWTFNGNHVADGEYVTFDTVGVPTMHLDNDTVYDPGSPGQHTITGDLECGGTTRSILCCYASCTP